MDYNSFSKLTRSSKQVLCHIEPSNRVTVFDLVSGSIYKKSVAQYVISVKENGAELVKREDANLVSGEYFFDSFNNELYIRTSDDSPPKTKTIILTYRLFFASSSLDLPFDLIDGDEVNYDGRLKSNSPITKELDDEQIGVVLETKSGVTFENSDGYFDDIYDSFVFENKRIAIWSWSESIKLSEKKKLFDGVIQDKSFSSSQVKFTCKDFTYALREKVSSDRFGVVDGSIPERYLYTPKRKIFGQFKQLRCVPVDSILEGYSLSGSITGSSQSDQVTGVGTSFLSELSPNDELIVVSGNETYNLGIASIESDNNLTLSSELEFNLNNGALVKPERPYRQKNRRWHIAGHRLRAPETTISSASQPNRFTVNSSVDLFANDLIEVNGEAAFIRRINGNDIVLFSNLQSGTPSVSDSVTKNPVSKVYVDGAQAFIERDWSLFNNASDAVLELDPLLEFNVASQINIPNDIQFTNNSREITVAGLDLRNEVKSRDWIRSGDATHSTWYEILEVKENSLLLRASYGGATYLGQARKKNVKLINDESVIAVDCLGLERSGKWVKTASDAVLELIENDANLTNIDFNSFIEASNDAPFVLSYAMPERVGGELKSIKSVISDINKSVFGSLVTSSDFNLKYQILTPERPSTLSQIQDDDLSQSSVSVSSRGEIVRKVSAKYSFFVDKFNGDESFELYEFVNQFVDDVVGSRGEMDVNLHLFNLDDAKTIAQRYALYNSLAQSKITIKGKLNLALFSLNDKIWYNFDRIYKRFASSGSNKIGIINKVSQNGYDTTLEINDLGNSFGRVAVVSPENASDFTSAQDSEKIFSSYIVDAETLTPDIASDKELFSNLIG